MKTHVCDEVSKRQKIERAIARRLILDGLAAGFTIAVHNGEELLPVRSKVRDVLADMFSVDEEHLFFYGADGRRFGWVCGADGRRVGWVFFVYGNDGWDVINDYTCNLETIMFGADALGDSTSWRAERCWF